MRPAKTMPRLPSAGSTSRARVAGPVEALLVERGRREVGTAEVSRGDVGPLDRSSSLAPTGASLIWTPGSGTPMLPASSSGKCADVTAGAVSVAPHEVVIATSAPANFEDSSRSRSHRSADSDAPA